MATVTASSYAVSGSACHSHRGASRREAKVNSLAQVSLNYDGLRSLNKLHVRTTRAAKTKTLLSAKSNKSGHDGVLGRIKCGMNMIFVGTEVAPWSKTGGLGDVLGGLPPALAVCGFIIVLILLPVLTLIFLPFIPFNFTLSRVILNLSLNPLKLRVKVQNNTTKIDPTVKKITHILQGFGFNFCC